MKQPTIEVRYTNLCVAAECEVVYGKPLPTLWNSFTSMILVSLLSFVLGIHSSSANQSIYTRS